MRRTLLIVSMLLVWVVLLACCWRGLHAFTVPAEAEPTFFAPLAPTIHDDPKFDLVTLTADEALLAWADANGVHQVRMSRRDFDGMFGVVRVEPLTPEEQQGRRP